MKTSKLLSVLLVLALSLTMVVAFAEEAPLEFTYLRPVWDTPTYTPDGPYELYLEEQANVKIDVQIIPVIEYDAKVKTVVAGGELPDVMWAFGPTDSFWRDVEDQGAYAPIEEMLEKYPAVKASVSEAVWNIMRNGDGHIYFMPRTIYAMVPFFTFYRADILNELGVAVPTTIEEFEAALEAVRDAYPDMVPATVGMGDTVWMYKDLATSFGAVCGGWNVDPEDENHIVSPYASERHIDFMFWLQDLKARGLLDAEAGINSDVNFGKSKFKAGYAFSYPGGYPDFIEATVALRETNPEAVVAILPPLTGDTGIEGGSRTSFPVDRGMYFNANLSKDKLDAIFAFIEWTLTEGNDVRKYGVEGEMHTVSDDGSKVVIPDGERKAEYKNPMIEPLNFLANQEDLMNWGDWQMSFEANGMGDSFEMWKEMFLLYCENQFGDYLNPAVVSPTNVKSGAQLWEDYMATAYSSVLLDTSFTREQYMTALDAYMQAGGQQIEDEINELQTDKTAPIY